MTPDDAARLLAACSAFDNRQPSEMGKQAWAAALRDLPADNDTFEAIARYYSAPAAPGETGRRWIEPHHVRTWRARIREERLGPTIPAYEPTDPDETGSTFTARRRAQLTAIADGRETPIPVQQLTGGPHPRLAHELASVGRHIPEQDDDEPYMPANFRQSIGLDTRPPEYAIPCPACRAPARTACRTPRGRTRTTTHDARKQAARETA